MHKTKTILLHVISIVSVVLIWGVGIQNIRVNIAGFLGLVAFKLLPDGIRGKLKDNNSFFIILTDTGGNTVHIPNNMVYQKIIKQLRTQ